MEDARAFERIKAKVASMESKIDLLESEITHLDEMLKRCGFPHGIVTLKSTVQEILTEMKDEEFQY